MRLTWLVASPTEARVAVSSTSSTLRAFQAKWHALLRRLRSLLTCGYCSCAFALQCSLFFESFHMLIHATTTEHADSYILLIVLFAIMAFGLLVGSPRGPPAPADAAPGGAGRLPGPPSCH